MVCVTFNGAYILPEWLRDRDRERLCLPLLGLCEPERLRTPFPVGLGERLLDTDFIERAGDCTGDCGVDWGGDSTGDCGVSIGDWGVDCGCESVGDCGGDCGGDSGGDCGGDGERIVCSSCEWLSWERSDPSILGERGIFSPRSLLLGLIGVSVNKLYHTDT